MARDLNRDKERRIAAQQAYPSFLERPSVDLTAADIDLQSRTDWIRQCKREDFIKGAEWADEHPREGLVDIDKACEWLKQDMIDNCAFQGRLRRMEIIDGIIEDFRKAMEG